MVSSLAGFSRRSPWGFIGLSLVAFVIVGLLLLPTAYLVIRASGAEAASWQKLLQWGTLQVMGRTLLLMVTVTATTMLIAVPLAWLTTRTDLPLRRLWVLLTPLPLVIPSYIGAALYASTFSPRGLLFQLIGPALGLRQFPAVYGLFGATFAISLLCYPYVLLGVRAVLLRMDPALEEVSRSLGQSLWQTFRRVTLPHLLPALGAGGLLVALYTLRDFGAVSIMRYDTFARVIYVQYRSFDRSQAAMSALVLVGLTILVLLFEAWLTSRRARYDHTAPPRPPTLIPLGKWKIPAFLFCCLIIGLALVTPALVLVYWLIRGIQAGEIVPTLGEYTWNSITASGLGAGVAVLAALPLAILVVRFPNPLTRIMERISYSTYAMPGIVIALSLVFWGINYATPIYQTMPLLLLAYAILFIPQAVGAIRTALLQIHPQLEESARGLGRSPLNTFFTVTLPLARSGILAGAVLVFLTVMKELPATLILAPAGFRTLASAVWLSMSEAYFARGAAPALLLILVSSVPMAFLITREQRGEL